jgi:uroporphyrinogen decarboxylase
MISFLESQEAKKSSEHHAGSCVKPVDISRVPQFSFSIPLLTGVEFREVRKHHDFFTICQTPELACQITLQPIDRYAGLLDASIIFCDILVIPQAMGMTIQMLEAKGPTFDDPLVTPEDIKKLKEKVDVRKELGYVMEAISLTRRELNGRVPLLGFIGAPWTLLAYMIEGGGSKTFTKAKGWLYKYPEETKALLQRITDIAIEFLAEQVIAGAQVYHTSTILTEDGTSI